MQAPPRRGPPRGRTGRGRTGRGRTEAATECHTGLLAPPAPYRDRGAVRGSPSTPGPPRARWGALGAEWRHRAARTGNPSAGAANRRPHAEGCLHRQGGEGVAPTRPGEERTAPFSQMRLGPTVAVRNPSWRTLKRTAHRPRRFPRRTRAAPSPWGVAWDRGGGPGGPISARSFPVDQYATARNHGTSPAETTTRSTRPDPLLSRQKCSQEQLAETGVPPHRRRHTTGRLPMAPEAHIRRGPEPPSGPSPARKYRRVTHPSLRARSRSPPSTDPARHGPPESGGTRGARLRRPVRPGEASSPRYLVLL